WQRARVDAELAADNVLRVDLENVTAFTVTLPPGHSPFDPARPVRVRINGREIEAPRTVSDRSWQASFHKERSRWKAGAPPESRPRTRHVLQAPSDDAFMRSCLLVRPTGDLLNDGVRACTAAELSRFTNEWRRHSPGDTRVKDDSAVTADEIARQNLSV